MTMGGAALPRLGLERFKQSLQPQEANQFIAS
jgi:hypothetical protein